MSNKFMTRRELLKGTALAAVALSGRLGFAGEGAHKITRGTDVVTLGKTGIRTSVLGIGTGTRGGREQLDLGQAAFTKLVRHAYDRGIRYIDTADAYRTHMFVRFALQELPREEIFIQTKTRAEHPEVAKADIERFRKELQVDYIDSLLIHFMRKGSWPTDMRPIMDVLLDAKEKGHVRAVGVSCHGMEPLAAAADCDWVEIHLVRINPFETKMDGPPEDVAAKIAKMHQQGCGVIGMKVYGEGQFSTREQRFESLKYVLGLGTVDAFTIGFGNAEQIDETLELIEKATA